jgi:hypothetical protein
MLYYKYLKIEGLEMTAGAGPKLPLGASDLKNENGLTLNADLQPGSGAWDGIFHHRIVKQLVSRPSLVVTNFLTYRLTGVNPDYLGSQQYEFGNEFQLVLGASEQKPVGNQLLSYGVNLRYRHARQDRINHQWLPNTGGQWIFIIPALAWHATTDLAVTLNGEFPIYSQVQGTQLTPTFRFNMGFYFSFRDKKSDLLKINETK